MKYFVRVDGAEREVVVEGETVTVDGQPLRAHIEELPGTPLLLVSIGHQVHRLHARRLERGTWDISMAGHRLTVEALDERSRAIRELSGRGGKGSGPAHLVAPMPGLIVRISVREGDTVQAGQGLVVMEAMKMENELRAPGPGSVARVVVSPGTAVEKGAVLIEMASPTLESA